MYVKTKSIKFCFCTKVARAVGEDSDLVPTTVAVLRTVNDICAKGSDKGFDMSDRLEGILTPVYRYKTNVAQN